MNRAPIYRFLSYSLEPARRELRRDGELLAVPARVFDLLVYLIEHRSRAVGRDELGAAVWGRADVSEAQLTQTVLRARRLLGEDRGGPSVIHTIPKFGYRWECEVETGAGEPAVTPQDPAAETPIADSPRRGPRRWIAAAVLALAVALTAAVWQFRAPPPKTRVEPSPPAALHGALVLPIENGGSSDDAWVRLGGIDLIGNRLRSAGLPVAPGETTLALLGSLGDTAPDALRQGSGARWIIAGRTQRSAGGWRATLEASDAAGNRHTASADAADVLAALRASTDLLLRELSLTPPITPSRDSSVEEIVQRAQAALLENDFDAAQRLLASAPAAALGQGELRYQLAGLAFRAGRLVEAEAQLRELLADESAAADPALQGRIHYALGAIGMMRDRAAEAEREFGLALNLFDRRTQILDYGKALGGRGGARIAQGDLPHGLDDLAQARVLLAQAGDRLALARMNLAYGIAELHRDRPGQAVAVLSDALGQLAPFGAINERLHAYSAVVNAQIELVNYAEATRANDAARALLPRVADPLNRAETQLDQLSLLLRQGRYAEAEAATNDINALDLAAHASLDGRRDALEAELAFARGHLAEAVTRAAAAITKLAPLDRDAAAGMILLHQRALVAAGRAAEAPEALRTATAALHADGAPLPISLRLARAELMTDGSQRAAEYAAALADAQAREVPAQLLSVAKALVPELIAQGHVEAASAILGRLDAATSSDFDAALLLLRLHQASGQNRAWSEALRRAQSIAGERRIPAELQLAPGLQPALKND